MEAGEPACVESRTRPVAESVSWRKYPKVFFWRRWRSSSE